VIESGIACLLMGTNFPEKGSKRQSQTISDAVPAAVAADEEPRPTPENGKVTPPRRVANRERRTREHLTPQEVDKLIKAASRVGRYGHRDATLILIAYRHGLRVSELVALRWDQVDLEQGLLHVSRLKNGCLRHTRSAGRRYGHCGGYVASTGLLRISSRPSDEV
jgi:integrase